MVIPNRSYFVVADTWTFSI